MSRRWGEDDRDRLEEGEGEFSHFKKRRARRPFIKCLFEGGKISLADTGEEVLVGFDLRPDSAYVGCQGYPVGCNGHMQSYGRDGRNREGYRVSDLPMFPLSNHFIS